MSHTQAASANPPSDGCAASLDVRSWEVHTTVVHGSKPQCRAPPPPTPTHTLTHTHSLAKHLENVGSGWGKSTTRIRSDGGSSPGRHPTKIQDTQPRLRRFGRSLEQLERCTGQWVRSRGFCEHHDHPSLRSPFLSLQQAVPATG
jgi:hypothetical protein